jgi:hypothetical protein
LYVDPVSYPARIHAVDRSRFKPTLSLISEECDHLSSEHHWLRFVDNFSIID